jgi:integrase
MPGYVRKRHTKNGKVAKRRDGSTKWQARYWDPSDPSKRIEKMFRRKEDGERWLTQQGASILTGTHVDPRRGDRPFREVAEAWQETWVDLEPKTKACYRTALDNHLLPEFGSRKVTAITPELVQKLINRMSKEGKAPGTVRGTYAVLRNALNAGVRLRMIAVNPCTGVRLPRQSKEEMLFLSGEEVRALAEAITPHFRVLIYTAAYTGLRSGELRALRRKRVDLLRGRIHVAEALKEINGKALAESDKGIIFGPTKNHQDRTVTLPRFLRDMLNDHLTASPGGPDDLVFTSREGAPIRQSLFYRRHFKPAVKGRPASKGHPAVKGALPERLHGLRFHDLRHTCASLLIAAGAHPKAIQEQLGHSSITITMDRYGHLLPSAHESLADRLDAAYARKPADNVSELLR